MCGNWFRPDEWCALLRFALLVLQPAARLIGRLRYGLTPWRRRGELVFAMPWPRRRQIWSERWRDPQAWVEQLQDGLAAAGGFVRSGGPFDRWDLDLRAGAFGGVKIRTAVEEHGDGRQMLLARVWPRTTTTGRLVVLVLVLLALVAVWQGEPAIAIAIGIGAILMVTFGLEGMATATQLALAELETLDGEGPDGAAPEIVEAPIAAPPQTLSRLPEASRREPNLVRQVFHGHEEERR